MIDKNDALMFARYLIEDNQEEYITLNMDRKNNYKFIRSVFR